MTGREFAEAMDITPETVSRWENGERGVGSYTEKLLRHNIGALPHSKVQGVAYDPADIVAMKIIEPSDDLDTLVITCRRVMVHHGRELEETWGLSKKVA